MFKGLFGSQKSDSELYTPRMPEVDEPTNIATIFDQARQAAGGEIAPPKGGEERQVILVTPGRMLMFKPCPPPGSMSRDQVADIEKMIPPHVKRNIAVIAYTELKAITTDTAKAIQFLGILMGFAYIGHAVWIFEGHASALAVGCREADVLLVDSGMAPHLSENWKTLAAGTMRHKEIYIHDRTSYSLRRT